MLRKAPRQVPHDTLRRACRPIPIESLEPRQFLAVTPLGPELLLKANGYNSDLAMAADGSFVLAWQGSASGGNGVDVYAQCYSAAGVPQGTGFRVNTYINDHQIAPAVAMDADGDFVIAWTSYNQDGSNTGVYAQRYTAAGIPQGGEFRVNTCTTRSQHVPDVAMDANGDFVIAWQSYGQDGSMHDVYAQRYSADGTAQGDEFRVNTTTDGQQGNAAIAMNANGDFVITWIGVGFYAQRYHADGQPQGNEFRVDSPSNRFIGSFGHPAMNARGDSVIIYESLNGITIRRYNTDGQPQGDPYIEPISGRIRDSTIAMDPDGDFVITWTWYDSDPPLAPWDVYARRYTADAQPQGPQFRVNTQVDGHQGSSSVAIDADGNFVIAWESDPSKGSFNDIYARRYAPDMPVPNPATMSGIAWDDANADGVRNPSELGVAGVTVRIVSASDSLLYSTTTDGNGAYRFDTVPAGDYYVIFLPPAGRAITSQKQGIDDTLDSDPDPTTGRTAVFSLRPGQTDLSRDAGLLRPASVSGIVYDDLNRNGLRDVNELLLASAQIYIDVNGNSRRDFGEPVFYSQGDGQYTLPSLRPGDYRLGIVVPDYYKSTASETGLLSITLGPGEQRSGLDFAMQKIILPTPQPTPLGPEFRVNTYTLSSQMSPAVAMDTLGNAVIAWESLNQDGSASGIYAQRYSSAGLAQGTEFRVNTTTSGSQVSPATAMDADGDFVITWTADGIYAQRYNAAGEPQGSEFRVNTTSGFTACESAVAMDAKGNFVIAWASKDQDGSGCGVYAQRYNAAGVPQGTEFRVNTNTASDQRFPALAMDTDGDFVIVWQSYGQDGWGYGIFAQRYDANGEPQSDEFRVNTYTNSMQESPTLGMDADGSFAIAWQSQQDGSGFGIYAQRYNPAGLPQGSEFRVNTYTSGNQYTPTLAMDADGDFLIAWRSDAQGGNWYDIYAQRYNAAGIPQGSEFRVNIYSSKQGLPAAAMNAVGDVIVAWESYYHDGSAYGVCARRYLHGDPPLTATTLPDTFRLIRSAIGILVSVDGAFPDRLYTHPLASALPVTLAGLAGDDRLILDFSNGNPIPAAGLIFTGGDGNDSILFTTSTTYASFTTPLDLTDNTLLVQNATLSQVQAWLPAKLLFTSFKTQYTTLAPFPQPDGSILVKLTYYGDTNADGQVNLSDYFTIDSGYLNQRQGFTHGDANLDGQINLSDYFLIDSAYLNQSRPLGAARASSVAADSSSDEYRRIPRTKDKTGGRRKVFSTQRFKLGRRDKLHARQSKLSR